MYKLVSGYRWPLALTLVLCVLSVVLIACGSQTESTPTSAKNVLQEVNVFVGTEAGAADFGTGGGAGNTFPGATRPFGMLQLSPDTYPSSTNFAGGYTYSDKLIRGFSLTHISGAGCALYQDISLMPTLLAVNKSPVSLSTAHLNAEFRLPFDHAKESASPGEYRVLLNPATPANAIDVALTADERSGLMQLKFPTGQAGTLLINAGASAMANSAAEVQIDAAAGRVTGSATSGRFCYLDNRYRVYFVAEFNRPFVSQATWQRTLFQENSDRAADTAILPINYVPIPGGPTSVPGDPSGTAQAGAVLRFAASDKPILVRMGISFVSADNALKNLRAEIPQWDFQSELRQSQSAWENALNTIRISGGDDTQRRNFYTALYHSQLAPNLFSDVNGEYLGFDGAIHRAHGWRQHHNFSGWDIYRSQIPLLAIIQPERTGELMRSILTQAQQSKDALPKWSFANQHANVMVGDPASPMLATAQAYGVKGFDEAEAQRLMLLNARTPLQSNNPSATAGYVPRPGLASYQTLGYIPSEQNVQFAGAGVINPSLVWGTASTTLEYAFSDFTIGRFAARRCKGSEASDVAMRAENWRNLLNARSGYLEPRSVSSLFNPLFDPASDDNYVEGSGAQYSWSVPHNFAGLIEARGGRAATLALLDAHYESVNAGPKSAKAFLGNEPGLSTPWLYAWLDAPHRTQEVVHRAMTTLYAPTPEGMPGNDDLGTLSAWWVLAALGMNPVIPGTDLLALSTPLFPSALIARQGGDWSIRASGEGIYTDEAKLGSLAHTRAWVTLRELDAARHLSFSRGGKPSSWGVGHPPPSFQKVPSNCES